MKEGSESCDCVVVGAGIAGLLAATVLRESGARVCVLDKGRGVGGRMATRRRDGAVFDHGAQFFTVRDAGFRQWVDVWSRLGLVEPWYCHGDAGTHYRGVPGMTAVAKHLASTLQVRTSATVSSVRHDGSRWSVRVRDGEAISARALILTAPVPQAIALLEAGGVTLEAAALPALRAIRYERCIAALAILDRPSGLHAHHGALKLATEPVQWIADNQRKGVSPDVPAVTIHSTPAFAEAHWDSADAERLPQLLAAAAPYLEAGVLSCHGHRWGFSAPVGRYSRTAFLDLERSLAIAGDGMAGGRVEGAALSGLAAAGELVTMLNLD